MDVEEGFSRRLVLPDVGGANRYLRATWHEETSTIVFSHWHEDVCVSSTPVSLVEATKLIGMMVGAWQEAALRPGETATTPPPPGGLLDRLQQRLRPQLAEVVKLADRLRPDRPSRGSRGA